MTDYLKAREAAIQAMNAEVSGRPASGRINLDTDNRAAELDAALSAFEAQVLVLVPKVPDETILAAMEEASQDAGYVRYDNERERIHIENAPRYAAAIATALQDRQKK